MSSIQGVFWDLTACVFVFLLHLTTRVPQCPHRQAWLVSVSYFFYFERIGWICGCVGVELTQIATCGLALWHQLGTKPLNTKPCSWGLSLSTKVRDLNGSIIRSIQNLWQKVPRQVWWPKCLPGSSLSLSYSCQDNAWLIFFWYEAKSGVIFSYVKNLGSTGWKWQPPCSHPPSPTQLWPRCSSLSSSSSQGSDHQLKMQNVKSSRQSYHHSTLDGTPVPRLTIIIRIIIHRWLLVLKTTTAAPCSPPFSLLGSPSLR